MQELIKLIQAMSEQLRTASANLDTLRAIAVELAAMQAERDGQIESLRAIAVSLADRVEALEKRVK